MKLEKRDHMCARLCVHMHASTRVCMCLWAHVHVCMCILRYIHLSVHMWRSGVHIRCPSLSLCNLLVRVSH